MTSKMQSNYQYIDDYEDNKDFVLYCISFSYHLLKSVSQKLLHFVEPFNILVPGELLYLNMQRIGFGIFYWGIGIFMHDFSKVSAPCAVPVIWRDTESRSRVYRLMVPGSLY